MTGGPAEGQGPWAAEVEETPKAPVQAQASPVIAAPTSQGLDAPAVSQPPAIDLTQDSEPDPSSSTSDGAPIPVLNADQPAAIEAKKTFSLFDKGSWGAAPAAGAAGAATDAANGPDRNGASTSKRPRRAAATRGDTARQAGVAAFLAATELPDDADAFQIMGASMKNGGGKRKKIAAAAAQAPASQASKKAGPSRPASPEKKSPPRPVPAPAPPKPISLKVKGTAPPQDPSQVHSFFAARPRKREEDAQGDPAAASTQAPSTWSHQPNISKSLGPPFRAPKAARKPQLEPEWPSSNSIHVQPADSGSAMRMETQSLPRIGPFDRKGKGKAMEPPDEDVSVANVSAAGPSTALALPVMAVQSTSSLVHALSPSHNRAGGTVLGSHLPNLTSLRGNVAPAIEKAYLAARATAAAQQASGAPPDSGQIWTERFRPQAAEEVLGNEEVAVYLRDWLRELQIRPTAAKGGVQSVFDGTGSGASTPTPSQPLARKRRIVQTRVDRAKAVRATKRRRGGAANGFGPGSTDDEDDGMSNFIVDDDEEQEAWLQQFYPTSSSTLQQQQTQDSEDSMLQLPSSVPSHLAGSTSPASTTTDLPTVDASASQDNSTLRFDPEGRLTNCILLVGPVGAGKTSAAYACASELGFEVFELFPGMRKRAGKDLASAVGELGRNHMVGSGGSAGGGNAAQRGSQGANANVLKQMMGASQGEAQAGGGAEEAGKEGGPVPSGDSTTGTNANGAPVTRQSLILIEEVDVTFEDDKGFWTGIVDLVAESKRPVVLTCNDMTQVPVETLPLQTVLYFEAAAPELAVPYLQLCAAAAGAACPTEAVRSLYLSTRSSMVDPAAIDMAIFEGLQDGPTSPSRTLGIPDKAALAPTAEATKALDLRQALTQLQLLSQHAKMGTQGTVATQPGRGDGVDAHASCVTSTSEATLGGGASIEGPRSKSQELQELRQVSRRLELASFAHGSAMSLSLDMVSEAFEAGPASDMVWQGCIALPSVSLPHQGCPATVLQRHVAIQQALDLGGTIATPLDRPAHVMDVRCSAAFECYEHARSIWTLLSPLRISPQSRLPRLESVLDYGPYVRSMVLMDEAEREAHEKLVATALAEQQSRGQGSRMTRNSIRHLVGVGQQARGVEFQGWLDFDEEGVEAVRRSGFDLQSFA